LQLGTLHNKGPFTYYVRKEGEGYLSFAILRTGVYARKGVSRQNVRTQIKKIIFVSSFLNSSEKIENNQFLYHDVKLKQT